MGTVIAEQEVINPPPHEREAILVLDYNASDLKLSQNSIAEEIPGAEIIGVVNFEDYQRIIRDKDFDVVVLNSFTLEERGVDLIHQLKVKDHDPAILVVSNNEDPKLIAAAFHSGCHRCLVKDGEWKQRIGPAVRALLRHRRLESVNATLIAKLTEANALLEEENSRLDEFAKTVAHDIRGPLGGISMKLEYMRDVYKDEVDDRFRHLLESSLASSRRLIAVVQAMYEFAKLGTQALQLEKIDLRQFIEEVVSDLHFEDSIELRIGIGDLPPIWGDTDLLRKVFLNLISNAVKYSDKKSVVVNVGVNQIINRSLADFCEIFIEDNGPGILAEDIEHIFGMFTRGINVAKSVEGTGIGLAVVRRIVEMHLGRVRVESLPGKGARFLISLPMDKVSLDATNAGEG